jgi:IS5 family transposase
MKDDYRLRRNYLKGKEGDHMNAILAGAGFNFRKLFSFLTPIFDFSFLFFRPLNRTSGHFAYLPV